MPTVPVFLIHKENY